MNQRIRELARQSTGASTIYMLEEEWLKFAELIVRECSAYCQKQGIAPSAFTAEDLLEHFGVE